MSPMIQRTVRPPTSFRARTPFYPITTHRPFTRSHAHGNLKPAIYGSVDIMAEATQQKQQGGGAGGNVRIESKLVQRHCRPIPPGTKPLEGNEISEMLGGLNGWTQ